VIEYQGIVRQSKYIFTLQYVVFLFGDMRLKVQVTISRPPRRLFDFCRGVQKFLPIPTTSPFLPCSAGVSRQRALPGICAASGWRRGPSGWWLDFCRIRQAHPGQPGCSSFSLGSGRKSRSTSRSFRFLSGHTEIP